MFSGGQEIPIEEGSVLVLIGPNGGGKSTTLRNIEAFFTSPNQPRLAIDSLAVVREGTAQEFRVWLENHYPSRIVQASRHFRTRNGDIQEAQIENIWQSGEHMRGAQPFLIHRLDTEDRLGVTNRVSSIDPYGQPPQAYIHVLQARDDLRGKASTEVRHAFGVDLIINWGAGPQVGFHVGKEPRRTRDRHPVSEAYLAQLNLLPPLESEGDGIRSFTGCLLAALCGAHPVLLIDEPEAFLHPPQARRLSALLARTAEDLQRQVIMATHSADAIRGALEGSQRVSVCRITREGNVNNAALLGSKELTELSSKPLLRSSAALDGLFHEGVVVGEADADCRFYEALLRRMETRGKIDRAADLHFVHGAGKGQLAALVRAYRSLNTRTAVIADLDLLRDEAEFNSVVEALGGDLTNLQGRVNSARSALSGLPPPITLAEFLERARSILDEAGNADDLPSERRKELEHLLQDRADWSEAKRYGLHKLEGRRQKGRDWFARRKAAAARAEHDRDGGWPALLRRIARS